MIKQDRTHVYIELGHLSLKEARLNTHSAWVGLTFFLAQQAGLALENRVSLNVPSPEITRSADLNDDGLIDLVVGNLDQEILYVFAQTKPREFSIKQEIHLRKIDPDFFSMDFIIGHFTHDNSPDMIVFNKQNRILLFVGDGSGGFLKGKLLKIGPPANQIGTLVKRRSQPVDSILLLSKKVFSKKIGLALLTLIEGDFSQSKSLIDISSTLDQLNLADQNIEFDDCSAGDFNGDGISDLALTSIGSDLAVVLVGDSDGKFQLLAAWKTLGGPTRPTFLNLDGIGPEELLIGHYRNTKSQVYTLTNNQPKLTNELLTGYYTSGFEFFRVAGKSELVVLNYYLGALIWFPILPKGVVSETPSAMLKAAERGIFLGQSDLDSDGTPDLFVNDFREDKVLLFFDKQN